MEGVAGVVHWDQVDPGRPGYETARSLMVAEVNAVIEGVFEAGATEVVVNDSHSFMRNLPPPELDRRARLISGGLKPLSMVEGLQDGSFDAAIFVGYHAAAGAPGVLSHTYSSTTVHTLRLNGEPAGETTINAFAAGSLGVPLIMVAGDRDTAEEAARLPAEIETVVVKEARTRYSALSLHPEEARARLREAAARTCRRAASGSFRPLMTPFPTVFDISFMDPAMADAALLVPGSRRTGTTSVQFSHEDYLTAFKAARAMFTLAHSTL